METDLYQSGSLPIPEKIDLVHSEIIGIKDTF